MTAPDLVAGNSRLRARWPQLLGPDAPPAGPAELAALLRSNHANSGDLRSSDLRGGDRGAGSQTPESGDLLDAVDERRHERLRAGVRAYDGAARILVGALVSELDRADLVALLRAAIRTGPAHTHAVGVFTPAAVRWIVEGSGEGGAAAIVPRLVTHLGRAGDRDAGREVAAAWQRFELHGDAVELEAAVAAAHAAGVDRRLAGFGRVADPVRARVAALRDATNLVTAVRLREGDGRDAGSLLPPGEVPLSALRAVAAGADVVAAAPRSWRRVLERAAPDGVEALARACEAAAEAAARHVSWRTEPLSARVPVAYLAEVDAEARVLRGAASDAGRVAA